MWGTRIKDAVLDRAQCEILIASKGAQPEGAVILRTAYQRQATVWRS